MKRLIIFSLLVLLSIAANATVPQVVTHQGYLTDAVGVPVDGSTDLTFALYDVDTGGTALWTETQTIVVNQGVYAVALGAVSTLDPALFDGDLWLGLTVATGSEMTPREKLTSVPFALMAHSVADSVVTESKVADSAITEQKLADGAVTDAKLSGNISSSKIVGLDALLAQVAALQSQVNGLNSPPSCDFFLTQNANPGMDPKAGNPLVMQEFYFRYDEMMPLPRTFIVDDSIGHDGNVSYYDSDYIYGPLIVELDGDLLNLNYQLISKPAGSTAEFSEVPVEIAMPENGAWPGMFQFAADLDGDYVVELTCNDGKNPAASKTITLHVGVNPLIVNGDGTVTSLNSTLIVEEVPSADSMNSTINWYQAAGVYDATYNPTSIDTCGSLNLGGQTDWRLPTRDELKMLFRDDDSMNPVFGGSNGYYWSSTESTDPGMPGYVLVEQTLADGVQDPTMSFGAMCIRGTNSNLVYAPCRPGGAMCY